MKAIRYILVFAIMALLLAACGEDPLVIEENTTDNWNDETNINPHANHFFTYLFYVSVRDTSGNDLIAPLGEEYYRSDTRHRPNGEIDPAKLKVIVKRPDGGYSSIKTYTLARKFDEQRNLLPQNEDGTYEGKGIWYLSNQPQELGESVQDSMILSIQCNTLFGDYRYHDLTVFWEEEPHQYAMPPFEQFPVCTKAKLEGQEVNAEKVVTHYYENTEYAKDIIHYFLDFVLDR